jgi:hypothetical protein
LQEAKIFVAEPNFLIAMQVDVGPLAEEPFERQGGNGFLQWLTNLIACWIENG